MVTGREVSEANIYDSLGHIDLKMRETDLRDARITSRYATRCPPYLYTPVEHKYCTIPYMSHQYKDPQRHLCFSSLLMNSPHTILPILSPVYHSFPLPLLTNILLSASSLSSLLLCFPNIAPSTSPAPSQSPRPRTVSCASDLVPARSPGL
jgi:hypothetical protein